MVVAGINSVAVVVVETCPVEIVKLEAVVPGTLAFVIVLLVLSGTAVALVLDHLEKGY